MNNLPLQAHDDRADLKLPEVEHLENPMPINQFHANILRETDESPATHRNWQTQSRPVEPCRGYEPIGYPDNAI
jgi:hypothetical protein